MPKRQPNPYIGVKKKSNNRSPNIWDYLLKKTTYVPKGLSTHARGHKYQILEIVVAKLASLLESDYEWSVSPISGDGGVDFFGEKTIFKISQLGISTSSIIFGQCKYRSKAINLVSEFSSSLTLMSQDRNQRPTLVVLVAVGKLTANYENDFKLLQDQFKANIVVLSLNDVEHLISHYFPDIDDFLRKSLDKREYVRVAEHFRVSNLTLDIPPAGVVKHPRSADTGTPFDISINITFECPRLTPLLIRWNPPWGSDTENPVRSLSLRLLSPAAFAAPGGLIIDAPKRNQVELCLTFLSYGSGRRDLGTLLICAPDGSRMGEVELGRISVEERFHPPYFRGGVDRAFKTLRAITTRAGSGLVGAVAVRGVGGSGKTRLCKEIGHDVIASGGTWLSLSHPHTAETPYGLFRDLALALVPPPSATDAGGPEEAVTRHLERFAPSLVNMTAPVIEVLFEVASTKSKTLGSRGREALLKLLTVLILLRANAKLLVIHLSDLHWAGADGMAIIGGLIENLRSVRRVHARDNTPQGAIVIICEGRKGESTRRETLLAAPDYSTHAWERFSTLLLDPPIDVPELSASNSAKLLRHWFENQESPHRRIRNDLIAQQENDLFSAILAHGAGNPLYMIEYVILLVHEGLLKCNQNTGRFYLSRRIDGPLRSPETVAELIERRFRYIEEQTRPVANVIRGIALIQDRVPLPLFERLRDAFLSSAEEQAFLRTEMLDFPEERMGNVRFRHETFYALLKGRPIPPEVRERLVSIYLEWYADTEDAAVSNLWRRGLVLEQEVSPRPKSIEHAYQSALAGALAMEDYALTERVLEGLTRLYSATMDDGLDTSGKEFRDLVEARYELGCLRARLAKWSQARAELESLAETLSHPGKHAFKPLWLDVRIELGNVLIHQLLHDESIAVLRQALTDIKKFQSHASKADRKFWSKRFILASNRLGVAQWFGGSYERSRVTLQRAYDDAKKLNSPAQCLYRGIDVAALMIHTDPDAAFRMYQDLERLELAVNSSKDRCLITCEKVIAGLARERVRLESGTEINRSLLKWASELLDQSYHTAERNGFFLEQLWSALVLGVVKYHEDPEESIAWTAKALYLAFSVGNLEFLWMAHINLAQLCFQVGGVTNRESAVLHATEAMTLIGSDFMRRSTTSQSHRMRVIAAAVLHIHRILGDAAVGPLSVHMPELLEEPWLLISTKIMSRDAFSERAICLDIDDLDLYLLP